MATEAVTRETRDGSDVRDASAPRDFMSWFTEVERYALQSGIGRLLTRMGFHVQHTGGGCLAWERRLGANVAWISDGFDGLGDDVGAEEDRGKPWTVGVYNDDGSRWLEWDAVGILSAVAWAEEAIVKNYQS